LWAYRRVVRILIRHQGWELAQSEDLLYFRPGTLRASDGRRDSCPFDRRSYRRASAECFHLPWLAVDPVDDDDVVDVVVCVVSHCHHNHRRMEKEKREKKEKQINIERVLLFFTIFRIWNGKISISKRHKFESCRRLISQLEWKLFFMSSESTDPRTATDATAANSILMCFGFSLSVNLELPALENYVKRNLIKANRKSY